MVEQKLNVEQLINSTKENWPQDNLDAGATAVRLIRSGEIMLSNSRNIIEPFKITPAEFDTLATLRKMGAPYTLTPSELCKANLLSSGGLTKILIHLEDLRLISRQTNVSDKRSRLITLTKKGNNLVEKSMAMILKEHEQKLSAIYTMDERAQLNQLLRKLHLSDIYYSETNTKTEYENRVRS